MNPRIVIAGTSSGAGKTTVACGLIGALRARGLVVQGHKVGPDYIDPSHHALASGRPGRNLDAFLSGPDLIAPLLRHGATGADVSVIEGVMGLFDGASGRGELASTAHVAKLLNAPVLLVVDGSAMARSAAAVVHGFATFDPEVRVAGVIFNRVGSDGHEQLLREAVADLGIPVLGALRRDERIVAPERHLGLVPAVERVDRAYSALETLADVTASECDIDAIVELARAAPALTAAAWSPDVETDGAAARPRIAIARGPAFSFHYEENLELLAAAGAELVGFDPTVDESLPAGSDGLVLAGGFPEVYGDELAANAPLRDQIAALAAAGAPVLAECGGLLYLGESLEGREMCGVLPLRGEMAGLALGYREATCETPTPWLRSGETLRGHEFHYSRVHPTSAGAAGAAGSADSAGSAGAALPAAWRLSSRAHTREDGVVVGGVQASYLHTHWAATRQLASRFVAACARAGSPA